MRIVFCIKTHHNVLVLMSFLLWRKLITLITSVMGFDIAVVDDHMWILSPEGTSAAHERDADLFSDTSSITGRSALGSVSSSMASKSSG